jgi:alkylhydroperoxidase family enzyme
VSARLSYVEDPPAEVATVYAELKKTTGRVLNFWKLMAHHAPTVPAFLAWYRATRDGPLDLKLRQLAYVKVAQLNRCEY